MAGEQADKLPALLSGGEQLHAAIARALANEPALLLADDFTGPIFIRIQLEHIFPPYKAIQNQWMKIREIS